MPSVLEKRQERAVPQIEIISDRKEMWEPTAEAKVQDLLAQYAIPEDHIAEHMIREMYKLFPDDLEYLLKDAFEMFHKMGIYGREYVQLLLRVLIDGATVGFPNASFPFMRGLSRFVNGLDTFHPVNLLAWRIYMSDVLLQVTELRSRCLEELEQVHYKTDYLAMTKEELIGDPEEAMKRELLWIMALFGQAPELADGMVNRNETMKVFRALRYDVRHEDVEHSRFKLHDVFFPEEETCKWLQGRGLAIFHREEKTSSQRTLLIVGHASAAQMDKLFPSSPTLEYIREAQQAFGIPYEKLREVHLHSLSIK